MAARKRIVLELFGRFPQDTAYAVRFWDGEERRFGPPGREPVFTVSFRHERALRALFGSISLGFGEGYMDGAITVEGSLEAFLRLSNAPEVQERLRALSFIARIRIAMMVLRQRSTLARAGDNIARHYNHGNDFYTRWLDERMMYSCAYFRASDDTLERAQEQKLELICRKLQLREKKRVLDIGCGWGGFAIYAAQHYKARVLGVTLSEPQLAEGKRRVAEAGLTHLVELRRADYRTLTEVPFEKVLSIGMFEHVGLEQHPAYFQAVDRLLADGGTALLHTIGRMRPHKGDPWVHRYIFPGSYIPSLGECVEGIAATGQTITDVENLRIHYAMTLDHWRARFERQLDAVRAQGLDDRFIRMWRLYLTGSSEAFRYGGLCLWQIVSTKGLVQDAPLTRAHLTHEQRVVL
ncbi:MAG: cyclopropane-fatty-acyl-phospholipid synthase family protein [bacterium]|nr:cyclopropane-fatty-acyl-phospholipid synthase family protein [bacterium]